MGIGSGSRRRSGAAATGAHRLNSSHNVEWPRRQVDEMHVALAPALAPAPASSQSGAGSDCANVTGDGEWREWPHNTIP